jgi:hypothetical protein
MTKTINKIVLTIKAYSQLDDAIIVPQGRRFPHHTYATAAPVSQGD